MYCTIMPDMKATTTEMRMPEIIVSALALLMNWPTSAKLPAVV